MAYKNSIPAVSPMPGCTTGLLVTDKKGRVRASNNASSGWEAASTIKLPIVFMALHVMMERGHSLATTLKRQPHHNSVGSGYINWSDWQRIRLHDLLQAVLSNSDCVATNILIDYLGGKDAINRRLMAQGFSTRLLMDYLCFDEDPRAPTPAIGHTTTQDMLTIYRHLEDTVWPQPIRQLIDKAMSNLYMSWFDRLIVPAPKKCKHKTGSMVDCGPNGETVCNAVGSFKKGYRTYYFAYFSHCILGEEKTERLQQLRDYITYDFTQAYHAL